MNKVCVVWMLALCFGVSSYAQSAMGVFIESEDSMPAMRISELRTSVTIAGNRVVTNMDFTFKNQLPRMLEGEFRLPLQQGQSVYRFALDIDHEMREASIVNASKGRQSFEQIVREGIDPALLEVSKGNSYKARIYPIIPNGSRRVSIGFEEVLKSNGTEYIYSLPFEFSGLIDAFELTIESDGTTKPAASFVRPKIEFKTSQSGHIAHIGKTDFASGQSLEIRFPRKNKKTTSVQIEHNARSNETFFWAEIPSKSNDKVKAKSVTILWDQSLSGLARATSKDIDLLEQYLKSSQITKINLVSFAIQSSDRIQFGNTNSGRSQLTEHLSNIVYDGATRWKSIDFSQIDSDQILLFSDGIGTLGTKETSNTKVPIYAINSAKMADHAFLQSLADKTGGEYINTTILNDEAALLKLNQKRIQILDTHILNGSITDIESGTDASNSGTLWLTGRLLSETAEIKIVHGIRTKGAKTRTIQLDRANSVSSNRTIQRAWARARFRDFDIHSNESKEKAGDFAQRYGIITPLTSLIVLESVGDYARFEIEPPSALLNEYKKILKKKGDKSPFDLESKIEYIVREFADKIAWYETTFPSSPPPKPKPIEPQHAPGGGVESSPADNSDDDTEEIFELSPFTVNADATQGYRATSTLAGTRIRTELRDVASTVSVITREFLNETGTTNNEALLIYTTDTEVDGIGANFNDDSPNDEEKQKNGYNNREGKIEIAKWTPDVAYYQDLLNASDDDLPTFYLTLRDEVGATPAFFFDAATVFFDRGFRSDAIRILSNVCEVSPGNYLYLRAMGRRLIQFDAGTLAVEALEETLWHRVFEPQSYFDLGLAYDAAGNPFKAIRNFYHIVEMEEDDRFEEIELIALMEINRILILLPNLTETEFIDKRLIYPMPMDLRITLSWNTDDTDIDLWVVDPFGEQCDFSNELTAIGGAISYDITEGYGPEEFVLKTGATGTYSIQADYYGSNEQGINLPAIVSAKVTRNFSRSDEESQTITVRLRNEEEVVDLGSVSLKTTM